MEDDQPLHLDSLFDENHHLKMKIKTINQINDFIYTNMPGQQMLTKELLKDMTDESLDNIYQLYANNKYSAINTELEYQFFGNYYLYKKEWENAIICFVKSDNLDNILEGIECCKLSKSSAYLPSLYDKGIKQESIACMIGYGDYWVTRTHYRNAIVYYKMAFVKGQTDLFLKLADSYYQNSSFEKASEMYQYGIDKSEDFPDQLADCYIGKAKICEHTREYAQMETWYGKAIDMESTAAMCKFADYYRRKQDPDMMELYYRMAIDFEHLEAIDLLINAYSRFGNLAKIEEYYVMKISKSENKIPIIKKLISVLINSGYYSNTIPYYELMIKAGEMKMLYDLANRYGSLKQPHKQLECYRRAIDADVPDCFNNLGSYYYGLQPPNYPEAIKYYLQGAEKGEARCPANLNFALQKYPDMLYIRKAKKYIDKNTHHALNLRIGQFIEMYENGILDELQKDECCICLEDDQFMINTICPCNYGVCAVCYKQIKACPVCSDPIQV